MKPTHSPHVVVVGAGPAGAVVSNLLATRGIRVTLLERQSDFAREFRGEALVPSGVEVLKSLGLDEVLDRVPQAFPNVLELYLNRNRVFRLEREIAGGGDLQPRIISQPHLLEAIISETERRTDIRFERGASVKELFREEGRVVGLRVRTAEGERRIDCDFVIGCDGRASVVRRQAGLEVHHQDVPMDVVWFKTPVPETWKGHTIARFCMGHGHLILCYVNYDGLLQIAWLIPKGSYGELKQRGLDEWVEEMVGHAPHDLSDHLRANKDQLVNPFLLSTIADRVERWSVPGAMVLGDAAHTMSPLGGQGINIALRDAVVAANRLVPILRGGASSAEIDAAARQIEAERLPEVAWVQAFQARPPQLLFPRIWWAELARQVPRLLRYAPMRGLAERIVQPLLFGTTEVRLEV